MTKIGAPRVIPAVSGGGGTIAPIFAGVAEIKPESHHVRHRRRRDGDLVPLRREVKKGGIRNSMDVH